MQRRRPQAPLQAGQVTAQGRESGQTVMPQESGESAPVFVPQQRGVARHQRILDAALGVFTSKGYRDAAVDDIAAASETSKGGVYFHFPNKGAIFDALLRRTAALLADRVEASIASAPDPLARADAALETALRLFAEHRTLARLFLVDAPGAGPEFRDAIYAAHGEFEALITRHLDDAVAAGAIPALDTALAGTMWFGALDQVVERWLLTSRPADLMDVYPDLRAMLLRSIGAPVTLVPPGAPGEG